MLTANATPYFNSVDLPKIFNSYASYTHFFMGMKRDIALVKAGTAPTLVAYALVLADGTTIQHYEGKIEGRFMRNGDVHVIAAGGLIVNVSDMERMFLSLAAKHWNV